jgi:hypothetical protein
MSIQEARVPAGKLFCISRGQYSDYGYEGHFLALVNISRTMFQEVIDECNSLQKEENDKDEWMAGSFYGADSKFIPALIKRGWVMSVDCIEIHTGMYDELELT